METDIQKKGIKNALDILAPIISCNLIPWLRSFFYQKNINDWKFENLI